jgi:predicted Fe-Mo cluster-binding NifX family protein
MKIAFPVQTDQGMRSQVYNHFGSAQIFFIVDSETFAVTPVQNADLNHIHGQCQPLAALNGAVVDAVVVGGIGPGALRKLRAKGIQVFKAAAATVGENLERLAAGELTEFPDNHTCAGHGQDGSCAH